MQTLRNHQTSVDMTLSYSLCCWRSSTSVVPLPIHQKERGPKTAVNMKVYFQVVTRRNSPPHISVSLSEPATATTEFIQAKNALASGETSAEWSVAEVLTPSTSGHHAVSSSQEELREVHSVKASDGAPNTVEAPLDRFGRIFGWAVPPENYTGHPRHPRGGSR